MMTQTWNVTVFKEDRLAEIGQVVESTEALARCAALSKYAVGDDEYEEMTIEQAIAANRTGIMPDEEFSVSLA